jgi:hypothetical protein
MNKKYTPTLIIIILLIVLAMFWLYAPGFYGFLTLQQSSFFEEGELTGDRDMPAPPVLPKPGAIHDVDSNTLVAFRSFEGGTFRVSGVINKPTPCYALGHIVSTSGAGSSDVRIAFTLEDMSDPELACIQVIAEEQFDIWFDAPENANISATLNGIPITLLFLDGVPEELDSDTPRTQLVE